MKVVRQNGVRHALSRKEAEAIAEVFPADWKRAVESLILYQTSEDRVYSTYNAKSKTLGLFWPADPAPGLGVRAAIDELLIALGAAADLGHLPERMSPARRRQYLDAANHVRDRCLELVDAQLPVAAARRGTRS